MTTTVLRKTARLYTMTHFEPMKGYYQQNCSRNGGRWDGAPTGKACYGWLIQDSLVVLSKTGSISVVQLHSSFFGLPSHIFTSGKMAQCIVSMCITGPSVK